MFVWLLCARSQTDGSEYNVLENPKGEVKFLLPLSFNKRFNKQMTDLIIIQQPLY